ncbi:MAG: hypothetical protein ISQ14_05145 [Verrucomicrobiae bacterium]|nr:hypothetical protein [Verrucomicrobiae bacterium]
MDDQPAQSRLPAKLTEKFGQLESALWRKETSAAIFGGVLVILAAWAFVFVTDRFLDTPARVRSGVLIAMLLGVLACLVVWLRNWRWDRRAHKSYARLIQHSQRRLGDRLLGAVELATGEADANRMSPALRRAAILQVADSAADFDFTSIVDHSGTRRLMAVAGFAALLAVTAGALAPAASVNALVRLVAPFAGTPRYTFVRLVDLPEEMIVRHGVAFELGGRVEYRGIWRPSTGRVRFEQQPEKAIHPEGGRLRVSVEGQNESGMLRVTLGDAEARIAIRPTYPPAIRQLTARVTFPDYLNQSRTNRDFNTPTLTVLEGSRVKLIAEASRDLAGVRLEREGKEAFDLPFRENRFEAPEIEPVGEFRGALHITDRLGLTNAAPRQFTVRTRLDDPPNVQLLDLPTDISILESDVLPLKLFAQDDYGLKIVGVGWRIEELALTNQPAVREITEQITNSSQIEYTNTHLFSPTVLGIPPETTVEVRAAAADHYPDRELALSLKHRIHVVGNIRHAKAVREQLEAIFSQLEEITREEEGIAQKTAEAKIRNAQDPDESRDQRELDKLAADQERNNRHLADIARGGRRVLEEAMRNPVINQSTLKEWSQNVASMEDLAKNEMKDAADSLREAQSKPGEAGEPGEAGKPGQPQNSQQASQSQPSGQAQQSPSQPQQSERQKEMANAQDAQQKALQKMQEMQRKMNEGLDNLEAQTLAQRLQRSAGDEESISGQLRSVITETIGLKPYELPERYTLMNRRLATNQVDLSGSVKSIHDEIGRFFDRTQRPNYGRVNEAMKRANVEVGLATVGGLIHENIAMESMQGLNDWTKQLKEWADLLTPPESEESSQAGKGNANQQQQQKLIKMLISFLRFRLNELNLHHRTRLLSDQKPAAEALENATRKLALDQRDIRSRFAQLQLENDIDAFAELLALTQNELTSAEYGLRAGKTGDDVLKPQLEAVNHLSDLINLLNEQAKRQRQKQQQSQQPQSEQERQAMQQMQMLMQIAREQMQSAFARIPGSQPGENPAGGGTGKSGQTGGDGVGAGDPERAGERASATGTQVPAEFREVLERYFKAVEQQEAAQ